jgi:phage-related protein
VEVSVAGEDEVRIDASLRDDISAALAKIEQRIEAVERAVGTLGRKGAKSGEEFAAGMDTAADAADELGDQARQAKGEVDDLGDKAGKAGAKAAAGSAGLDLFAKKARKAGKSAGGLKTILTAFKIAGVVSGVFALAGGLSALGAGAAIAIGGMSPMIGVLATALPLFAAVKLSMLAWKLAATQLEAPMTRIKNQFTEMGPTIAKGGLVQGVNYFANSVGKLANLTGRGLAGLGAELGAAAHGAGDLVKSKDFLSQIAVILGILRPIVRFLAQGMIELGRAALNVLQAALPAAVGVAAAFQWVASSLRIWTEEQLANGKMTAWITHAWEMFVQVVGIVVDVVIGLYNVFKIAAGFAGNMGLAIHDAAWEFRQWTASAEGQARITKYFQDSLPALQEMGKLIKFVVGGLAGLGANQNVAPLLAQINSQLLPALAALVQNLSGQGGLGPAVISAATALAQLLAGLDFSGLTVFAQAIGGILQSLVWLQQNVPGANFVISSLLLSMLGFKLLGPVFDIIGRGAEAFSWMRTAAKATEELTLGQKVFQLAMKPLTFLLSGIGKVVTGVVVPALRMIAIAGVGALRALSTALFTTPIGWIILAIIAVIAAIWLLWTKCAWFRDAVMAVWNAIKTAAIATWDALKTAFFAVVDALVTAWNFVRDSAIAVWDALKAAWKATVDFIIMVAMWIWDHGLKQVLEGVIMAFKVAFGIVKFIVQTVIFFIALQIKLIAMAAEFVWGIIVAVFKWGVGIAADVWNWLVGVITAAWNWLWSSVLKPVIDFFVGGFQFAVAIVKVMWQQFISVITTAWNLLWFGVLKPVIDFFVGAWNFAMTAISAAATWVWGVIQNAINIFWAWLSPIFTAIGSAGSAVWSAISTAASIVWEGIKTGWSAVWDFLSGIWQKLQGAGTGVWDAIKSAANTVGDVIKGAWNGIKSAVAGVWNFLANGWNSIPSVTIPDWVPMIGGKTFSLPKLPTLWHGGEIDGGGRALVGEHGPEPVIKGGRLAGMVGMNGPEVTGIPKGGYVVPNLSTLNALPGLAKTLPSGVAAAVARSVPGYAGALSGGRPSGGGATGALAAQVGRLAHAVAHQQAPLSVNGGEDVYSAVLEAQRTLEREKNLRSKYHYGGK